MESIKLEIIRKDYHRGKIDIPVLKGVSLTVTRGEMVALMGVSGSGKTTLVNILGSLDVASSGRYWLDGEEISELSEKQSALLRNQTIGFVFQNFNLLPRLTALENVMMPLGYASRGLSDRECRERARELLERVGLGDRLDHQPTQLSGGEQQRVAIARALANRCSLLIADEPTGNLDSKTGEEILQVFQKLNAEDGLTIILVTHDPTVAAHAGRIVRIHDGVIVADSEGDGRPRPGPGRPKPLADLGPESEFESGAWPVHERTPRSGSLNHLRFFARTTAMALRSLRRNVLRSVLTTLGIIIGVASLIAIAEIGKGSASAIKQILTSMGANSLMIEAGAASSNGVSLGSGTIKTLTPEDAEAIGNECPAVNSLAPIVYTRRQVIYGNKNWIPIDIHGTTPGLLRVRDWEDPGRGRGVHHAGRPRRRPGLPARPDPRARAVRGRVADRQGGLRQRRAAPGHRRPEPQGDQHHRDRPGRHPARPLDDDQVPRQRRVVAPRDAARPMRTTRGRRSAPWADATRAR